MDWMPCNPINQYYISELKNCKDKPYLVTYRTLKGRLYVTKVNIKNGRIQGKVGGDVLAWMPLPQPYTADRKTEPTISKMEQVDKDINVRSKTEPQTDIHDLTDCDFCKDRNCKDCEGGKDEPQTGVSYSDHTDYDEPKNYVTWTEPQTDCAWK